VKEAKIPEGYFIHQKPYTKELVKKHELEERKATKVIE
jgi:hypothetical protein